MSDTDDIQHIVDAMLPPPSTDPNDPAFRTYFLRATNATVILGMSVIRIIGNDVMAALHCRESVLQRLRDCTDIYMRAAAAGLFFSRDPVPLLQAINYARPVLKPILIDPVAHSGIMQSLRTLCDMLNRERAGTLSISSGRPQVGSLTISFEGMRGIPSTVFNADSLKRQQALDALRTLDFTKRRPKVLFMAERDEESLDIVVGWKRMRDASGYLIDLKNVVSGSSVRVDVKSSDLQAPDPVAIDFYRRTMAPVMGSIAERDVALHRFRDVSPHSVYSLSIVPYQRVISAASGLFRTTLNRLVLTDDRLDSIGQSIQRMSLGLASGSDWITPYPEISRALYGTDRFGWMLAGLNLLSSFERGEVINTVRGYSYIGAKFSFIRRQIEAGAFYVPAEVTALEVALDRAFSDYGLSATLTEVFDKCGMLLFFDEREGFDVQNASIASDAALRETSIMRQILSAIDPVSATVSPDRVYELIRTGAVAAPPVTSGLTLMVIEAPRLDSSSEIIDILSYDGMTRLLNVIVDASKRA